MQKRLKIATDLCREAGKILRQGFTQEKTITYKDKNDLLTEFDLLSEDLIIRGIHNAFPDDSIVSEEREPFGHSDACWIIDPLDGTTNFAHSIPDFTISVAYVEDSRPSMGVIFDPMRDELYSAMRDDGARLNGQRMRVSETDNLEESLLSAGFPYRPQGKYLDIFRQWQKLYAASLGVRHLGCASLNLAYVASGRIDGYWELQLRPWDLAAGILLVEEAGGNVTRASGRDGVLTYPCSVLASNGQIHEDMLQILQYDNVEMDHA